MVSHRAWRRNGTIEAATLSEVCCGALSPGL
jgi:hypothetical protein